MNRPHPPSRHHDRPPHHRDSSSRDRRRDQHQDQRDPYSNPRRHSDRPPHSHSGSRLRSDRSSVPAKRPATDVEEDAWVAGEDKFVLQQAKQRAFIRVREGRARPIDWLALVARVLFEKDKKMLSLDGDEEDDDKVEIVDPEGVFASLRLDDLKKLKTELEVFCNLETDRHGKKYWDTMQAICNQKIKTASQKSGSHSSAGPISVDAEVEKLLGGKTESELVQLEAQIRAKLRSRDCVDVEYWENLLTDLMVLKDKAHLKAISQAVISKRLERVRKQQDESAAMLVDKLCAALNGKDSNATAPASFPRREAAGLFDPQPLLSLRQADKQLRTIDESKFLAQLSHERRNLRNLRYVPARPQHERDRELNQQLSAAVAESARKRTKLDAAPSGTSRFALPDTGTGSGPAEPSSTATAAAAAATSGGPDNDEEMLHAEDGHSVRPGWADQYRPRKPRYFNRVVMGYEWNKYNQTHFDHDNPPPKVPQGYKFNLFYPDLIDRTKAPSYRIEREKKGAASAGDGDPSSAAASSTGVFDTCLIRFTSGPPYEDICFRIVDREWDFSAKRERAFRCNFTEKGLLELHFQFKKIYYRK